MKPQKGSQSVKAQILVALIAYLLVHILKYSMKNDISMPDAMANPTASSDSEPI